MKLESGHSLECPDIVIKAVPGFIILLVFLSTALIPLETLQLKDLRRGTVILCRQLHTGERFSLSYIHSSELSTVTDYFQATGESEIVLYESRFCSLNTGLPSCIEKDEKLSREGVCFKLDNRNIKMHSFDFWVEKNYSNKLALADAVYNIPALLEESSNKSLNKSLVRLSIQKISLGSALWRKLPRSEKWI